MDICSRKCVQILQNWNMRVIDRFGTFTVTMHSPNVKLIHMYIYIVDFVQNKTNDVTFSTLRTGLVYYQLLLYGVLTIFEFHIFGLHQPYFTVINEYASNGRNKLSI